MLSTDWPDLEKEIAHKVEMAEMAEVLGSSSLNQELLEGRKAGPLSTVDPYTMCWASLQGFHLTKAVNSQRKF